MFIIIIIIIYTTIATGQLSRCHQQCNGAQLVLFHISTVRIGAG